MHKMVGGFKLACYLGTVNCLAIAIAPCGSRPAAFSTHDLKVAWRCDTLNAISLIHIEDFISWQRPDLTFQP
jgi:hypothetical protein